MRAHWGGASSHENIPAMPMLPGNALTLTIGTFDSFLDPLASVCDLRDLVFIDAYGPGRPRRRHRLPEGREDSLKPN